MASGLTVRVPPSLAQMQMPAPGDATGYTPPDRSWWSNFAGAGSSDYQGGQGYLHDPNIANYQNAYVPQADALYNQAGAALGQQQSAYNTLANMAAGNGPSLARANMNAGLQSSFNQLNANAMANQGNIGSGLGNRNLLNAEAAAQGSALTAGAQASAAEQLNAIGMQQGAANALTAGTQSLANQRFNEGQQLVNNRAVFDQNRGQVDNARLQQYNAGLGQSTVKNLGGVFDVAGKGAQTVGNISSAIAGVA